MKAVPAALQAHLETGATTLAWCWRVTRSASDGAVFGFTDHDRALSFDGTVFEPEAGFMAAELRAGVDLAVDAQAAEGVLSSQVITERDIAAGLWDNACVEVWRVNWQDTSQRVQIRRGSLGDVRRGRRHFVAEVRSLAHFVNQATGRLFQATCDARLGDARCGVDLEVAGFRGSGAVSVVRGLRVHEVTGLDGFAAGHFTLGFLVWTSGANAGLRAEVMEHGVDDGLVQIALFDAPVEAVAPGDAFTVYAGCDKSWETCRAKFANGANFRGFPHVPGQDAVTRFASNSDPNTGEVL